MKRFLEAAVAATVVALTWAAPFSVHAQAWPAKAVRIIVPSPPGGSTDQIARVMGQKLSLAWGQPG
ncbi:hypothetical protein ACSFA0_19390 [Variovorax sp. LT1P1]|uniref:hypothetical protein n=1 Tax=Variovorax sp. LT1P1 TaxID=3443730 RepID=UPI003F44A69D